MTNSRPPRPYTKSSRSGGSGGNCVEWAFQPDGVYLRDSKNPTGPELLVTYPEWSSFVAAAAAGDDHQLIERCPSRSVNLHHDGRMLRFTSSEWTAFVEAARTGECSAPASSPVGSAAGR
ncbi:DUF397 domain-containing protein [Micromonospora sp. NBC_01813]|uniref:DUF397 domain-containing protein n=1 Tax=Micromonospora sp. NBC_01813 TaxID=2975988 RepID=UPI002DDAD3F3|nr:DUF397 domain-containing protein [Micromonospora sp. NBC_01813]